MPITLLSSEISPPLSLPSFLSSLTFSFPEGTCSCCGHALLPVRAGIGRWCVSRCIPPRRRMLYWSCAAPSLLHGHLVGNVASGDAPSLLSHFLCVRVPPTRVVTIRYRTLEGGDYGSFISEGCYGKWYLHFIPSFLSRMAVLHDLIPIERGKGGGREGRWQWRGR